MKRSFPPIHPILTLGFCLVFLSGCIFDNTGTQSAAKNWAGLPLDSIQSAGQVMAFGGSLFVANRDSASPGLAVIDTTTGKISAYYPEELPPMNMALTQDGNLIITETNYSQGAVSVFNPAAMVLQKSLIAFGPDNFVDTAGGKAYLFDHTSGVVTGFTGHMPNQNIVFNVQTGANSNPYDIAVSGNLAFIPRYNSNSLLVLDATMLGGGTPDSIDLSQFDSRHPADTVAPAPRMAWATAYNGFVFVALQRLNYDYTALDTSLVVVINASTKQVVSTIPLNFKNPIAAHALGSAWYVVGIGNYDQTGGVEKIDLNLQKNSGVLLGASILSADIFDFAVTGVHSGYAAYSTNYGVTTKVKKVSY